MKEALPYFDKNYYLNANPDINPKQVDPFDHYMFTGWKEGRDPSPNFSTRSYLKAYPQLSQENICPLQHFAKERPFKTTIFLREKSNITLGLLKKWYHQRQIQKHFNKKYYLRKYADIDPEYVDPFDHYMFIGWKEGRDPSPDFSTQDYLDANPDVATSDTNPLRHFIIHGKAEGRSIKPDPSLKREKMQYLPKEYFMGFLANQSTTYEERPLLPQSTKAKASNLDIHWVIPDFGIGSGGHMNIFRIVRWLELFGHKCTLWLSDCQFHPEGKNAYEDIVTHFQLIKAEVKPIDQDLFTKGGDVIMATGWQTVPPVLHAQKFKERFYFIQDFEPNFFSEGSFSNLAKETYKNDFACICGGEWLKEKISTEFNRWTRHFDFATDEDDAQPCDHHNPREDQLKKYQEIIYPRLACYFRPETPRRCTELLLASLDKLHQRGVKFHADFFGSDQAISDLDYSASFHGILNHKELGLLYRESAIGVCLSATNHSIMPKEMMAYRLPVLDLDMPNNSKIFPRNTISLVSPTPQAIADGLEYLLKNETSRKEQASNAFDWVSQFSWEKSTRSVETAIIDRLKEKNSIYEQKQGKHHHSNI